LAQFDDGHLSNSPSDAPVKILESIEEKKKENIIREVDTAIEALEQAMLGTGENWLGTMGNTDETSPHDGVEYDFGSDGDHGDEPIKVETDGQAKVKIDNWKKKTGLEGFKQRRTVKVITQKTQLVLADIDLATEGMSEDKQDADTERGGDSQSFGLGVQNLKASEVRPDEVSPNKEDIIVVEDLLESQQGLGPK
jgi:hypothetical protein